MSTFSNSKITITVAGVKRQVGPGNTSFKELIAELNLNAKITKFTVVSATPAQASVINGNDSYNFIGNEVMTSTIGA
jgi:hypothetical protein